MPSRGRQRKLSGLSLSTKIENVWITVHKDLHGETILHTAALTLKRATRESLTGNQSQANPDWKKAPVLKRE